MPMRTLDRQRETLERRERTVIGVPDWMTLSMRFGQFAFFVERQRRARTKPPML